MRTIRRSGLVAMNAGILCSVSILRSTGNRSNIGPRGHREFRLSIRRFDVIMHLSFHLYMIRTYIKGTRQYIFRLQTSTFWRRKAGRFRCRCPVPLSGAAVRYRCPVPLPGTAVQYRCPVRSKTRTRTKSRRASRSRSTGSYGGYRVGSSK